MSKLNTIISFRYFLKAHLLILVTYVCANGGKYVPQLMCAAQRDIFCFFPFCCTGGVQLVTLSSVLNDTLVAHAFRADDGWKRCLFRSQSLGEGN